MHTIDAHGPDRVFGFSPIPAMSMASHAAGARFVSLIGGAMLSFYDWYADLPVASPQVFGDQTDVPESADWWNASYLIMWGANVPQTRTPDAHFMAEARYRGQKVVTVSPDYADNTKFADEWMSPHPGTDGALGMAMGHVILKEFFIERQVPRFVDYVKKFSDLPFLVTLREKDGAYVPDKFVTAADLGDTSENANFKTVLVDSTTGRPHIPNGSMGCRYGAEGEGKWNLDLEGIDPALSLFGGRLTAEVLLPRFDVGQEGSEGGGDHRGVPAAELATSAGPRLVTTVYDLMLAQYGVGREGLPGEWPTGYDDPAPYTPAWQEEITGVPAAMAERMAGVRGQRRGVRRPLDHHPRGGHEPLVPLRHDLPHVPGPDHAHRLPGRERRRLGALRRPGEVPPGHRLGAAGVRPGLVAATAPDDRHRVLVRQHRPVALRRPGRRGPCLTAGRGSLRGPVDDRHAGAVGALGVDAQLPGPEPQSADHRRGRQGRRDGPVGLRRREAEVR